jgi:hypothetical protein
MVFKSLVKLDDSSVPRNIAWDIKKASGQIRRTEGQYSSICWHHELGKDKLSQEAATEDSAASQLLTELRITDKAKPMKLYFKHFSYLHSKNNQMVICIFS